MRRGGGGMRILHLPNNLMPEGKKIPPPLLTRPAFGSQFTVNICKNSFTVIKIKDGGGEGEKKGAPTNNSIEGGQLSKSQCSAITK